MGAAQCIFCEESFLPPDFPVLCTGTAPRLRLGGRRVWHWFTWRGCARAALHPLRLWLALNRLPQAQRFQRGAGLASPQAGCSTRRHRAAHAFFPKGKSRP